MKTHQITFTEKNRAELLEAEIDDQLAPNQALVKGEHSVVSAGTEGAGFTGLVQQMPFGGGGSYPATTGYDISARCLRSDPLSPCASRATGC